MKTATAFYRLERMLYSVQDYDGKRIWIFLTKSQCGKTHETTFGNSEESKTDLLKSHAYF